MSHNESRNVIKSKSDIIHLTHSNSNERTRRMDENKWKKIFSDSIWLTDIEFHLHLCHVISIVRKTNIFINKFQKENKTFSSFFNDRRSTSKEMIFQKEIFFVGISLELFVIFHHFQRWKHFQTFQKGIHRSLFSSLIRTRNSSYRFKRQINSNIIHVLRSISLWFIEWNDLSYQFVSLFSVFHRFSSLFSLDFHFISTFDFRSICIEFEKWSR